MGTVIAKFFLVRFGQLSGFNELFDFFDTQKLHEKPGRWVLAAQEGKIDFLFLSNGKIRNFSSL